MTSVRGQINADSAHERLPRADRSIKPDGQLREVRAQSGDTLSTIAQRYKISAGELAQLNHLNVRDKLRKGRRLLVPTVQANSNASAKSTKEGAQVVGKQIKLTDGRSLTVDEAWRQGTVVWYTKGGVTQSLDGGVEGIESIFAAGRGAEARGSTPVVTTETKTGPVASPSVWIYLVGGARFKVDEVNETSEGAWYSRGNLSVFIERERIARIEREMPGLPGGSRNSDWTSGNAWIDGLIRTNGEHHGLDPYLIFLVIEQESHFRQRAVSPKGARGLMQLMPGTARRLGVRDSFDPAQNIMGGSRYLKELMSMFGGRVDLVLASYNAGEGAVMKYGRAVPPYRETRDYVRRITRRYGQQENSHENGSS